MSNIELKSSACNSTELLNDILNNLLENQNITEDRKNMYKDIQNCIPTKDPTILSLLDDKEGPLEGAMLYMMLDSIRSEWNYQILDSDDCVKFLKFFKNEIILDKDDTSVKIIDDFLNFFDNKGTINPIDIIALVANPKITKYYDILKQIYSYIEDFELSEENGEENGVGENEVVSV